MISGIQTAALAPASGVGQAGVATPSAGAQSVLPPPQDIPGDPILALLALQSQSSRLQVESGLKDVQNNKLQRKKAYDAYKKALRAARKARKKGGFWKKAAKLCNKLGKYGAVAAAVAIAVGTGGVGAPASLAIAGAALSSASLLQSETQFLQKMGMSDEMAGAFQVGMGVGGMLCTGGAGGLAGAGGTVQAVGRGAAATSAAATAADGAATYQAGRYEGDARDREADAVAAKIEDQRLQRMFDRILDDIEYNEQSDQQAVDALRGALEKRDATALIVATRV